MSRHFCLVWRPWNMHVKMNPLNNWVRQSRMKISNERWKISRDYPEPGRENFSIYVYLGWYRALSWKLFFNTVYILFRPFYPSSRFFYHLYFNSFIISLYRFHGENDNNDDDDDDDDDTICVTFFFFSFRKIRQSPRRSLLLYNK